MPSPPFEILPSLPAVGPMYVSVGGNGKTYSSESFVVRFYKTNGTNWVGNFVPGWTKFSAVFELINSPLLLVIAGGACYLMKRDDMNPVGVFGVGISAALSAENGLDIGRPNRSDDNVTRWKTMANRKNFIGWD